MGLGPHGSSLLARLGRSQAPGEDALWIQIDQQARGEARMLARIRHQQKHKQPKKPEAPVKPYDSPGRGEKREWEWVGEAIESKGLWRGCVYTTACLRAAGFKLPRLQKQKKRREGGD